LRLWAPIHNRKNWLFVGSQQAGERAAVMLSLIESAKLRSGSVRLNSISRKISGHTAG
jgi:hypothetical protein